MLPSEPIPLHVKPYLGIRAQNIPASLRFLQHEKKSYANACRVAREGNAESRICEIPTQIEAYLVRNLLLKKEGIRYIIFTISHPALKHTTTVDPRGGGSTYI